GVPVVGVPASIDNDIGCTTSAIGVDTALNTIVAACDRISDTARAHRRVFVVEVMGRDCGYLAMAAAAAAGADAVLSREQGRSEDEIVDRLDAVVRDGLAPERGKRRVLVIKAEGVEVETAALVRRLQERVDRHTPGVDVRGTVLGHLVRGGSPSFHDRLIAGRLAVAAIDALRTGHAGEMAAWQPWLPGRDSVDPSVRMHPLEQVADETARLLDGTSPLARGRIDLLTRYEDVLAL
ncbi:MAG TPA: 6-phosphofructokinase, partial [Myxococcota bacterium]|nr:6-phosphofructokinase [Myxococcota bacterium]